MPRHEGDIGLPHVRSRPRGIGDGQGQKPRRTRHGSPTEPCSGALLEIIGEAASRVPAEQRLQHPDIPWPEIVGLRNRLIHGYDSVDFEILWQIVSDDLPPLIAALEKSLK